MYQMENVNWGGERHSSLRQGINTWREGIRRKWVRLHDKNSVRTKIEKPEEEYADSRGIDICRVLEK
jgi:hypothetical protein